MAADRSHRWLSHGAEALIERITPHPQDLHCDVLVVGSGYGGAVAAARLAGARPRAGGAAVRVWVLERGNEYLPGEFPATFAELPGHVRFSQQDGQPSRGRASGLFDLRVGADVSVLLGNGLGGGSLINAAVMERPSCDAFAADWPAGIDLDTLEPFYCRAEDMLQPETIPHTPQKLASLMAAGVAMGAPEYRNARVAVAFADGTTQAGVKVAKCLECGDCATGCNFRAKKSLDVNYLALARAKGAELFCGATVHCIQPLGTGPGYAVDFFLTEPLKAPSDTAAYRLNARQVILAAGSLGSTEILMRSAPHLALPDPSALGQRFSTNGDLIAAAYAQDEPAHCAAAEGVAPEARQVGPTITGLVRIPGPRGRRLVFQEFGIPAPLYRLLGEVVTTAAVLGDRFDPDMTLHRPGERIDDPLAVNAGLVDRTLVYGMMGDDGAAGTLTLRPGDAHDAQLAIEWEAVKSLPLFDDLLARLRTAHEPPGRCGGRVLPNPLWRPLPAVPVVTGPVITVHPLGGCRMADDKADGVVDAAGRVFAASGPRPTLPGLAVLDGAIVPVSLGINPALTIAALAERAVPLLAEDWDLVLDSEPKRLSPERPVRRDVSQPRAPAPTRFTLRERMVGRLSIQNQPFDASALIRFAPTDAGALRKLPRVIPFDHVEITLTRRTDGARWRLSCSGSAEVLVRDHSDMLTRWTRALGPAQRRLARFAPNPFGRLGGLRRLMALCTHLGGVRLIRYTCVVTQARLESPMGPDTSDPPIGEGARLCLTKRIAFNDRGNPWRQLSEGLLERTDGCNAELGAMETDLTYFADQMVPLLEIRSQQDAPNAIGDLAELALWILRVVLDIHLLNFLPAKDDDSSKTSQRLPEAVNGVAPAVYRLPADHRNGAPERRLSRYRSEERTSGVRPVLLIHGYGASGSTFTHHSIGPGQASMPLVSSLMAAGRDAWVLDLRTSIGLPGNKTRAWGFDEVANEDIPDALAEVLVHTAGEADGKVDVIAHCIGAAMFCVAVLSARDLHQKIGCVVLSQVAPLVTGSPMNRFRAYVAGYLEQYLGIRWFETRPVGNPNANLLIDAILSTFPYPDDDGEAERLRNLPDFAAVRHRADAIFGQTMRLQNIGDRTLGALDAIYGFVSVPGLAQVGHYVSQQVLTDATGQNQSVALETIATRFGFPLLIVHGRHNKVFDWRGSYRALVLLKKAFDKQPLPEQAPEIGESDLHVGGGTQRQLLVLAQYGHQDTLIGEHAHRDVFPHLVQFLDDFAHAGPSAGNPSPPLVVRVPWTGPTLGAVRRVSDKELRCRIALRPQRSHASTLAMVFIPVERDGARWKPDFDKMIAQFAHSADLIAQAQELGLRVDQLQRFQGFAVVCIHTELPLPLERGMVVQSVSDKDGLFVDATSELTPDARRAVQAWFDGAAQEAIEQTVVRLDPAWIAAAQLPGTPAQGSLCFALASCQYPAGLFDVMPAQASYQRLAARLDADTAAPRPHLLLLVGDQVYVDESAGLFALPGASAVERSYEVNHRLDAFRRVTRSLPTYPLLDDHEVLDNWEPPAPVAGALRAYVQRQHKLVASNVHAPFHHGFAAAGLPIAALDTRTTRDRRVLRRTDGAQLLADARIVSDASPAGLSSLLAAKPDDTSPKFIVSPVALFPMQRAAAFGDAAERIALDDWSGFPRSQLELLASVRDRPLRNLVLLSGDRHLSSVSSLWLERTDGTPIEVISIVSSGLYAPWPFANARADEFWLDGPLRLQPGDLRARIETPLIGRTDGFAVVSVVRGDDGVWTLQVEFDLADGLRHASKRLDGHPEGRWRVW